MMIFVHRKKPCICVVLGVRFLPGLNSLSDAEYEKVKNHYGFISEIECGNMLMTMRAETEGSTAVEAPDSKERSAKIAQEILSIDNIRVAKKAISELTDGEVLRAIKSMDGRKGVQEAVDARMKSIESQEGVDTSSVSIEAPGGDGSDVALRVSEKDIDGVPRSAIPAMNRLV